MGKGGAKVQKKRSNAQYTLNEVPLKDGRYAVGQLDYRRGSEQDVAGGLTKALSPAERPVGRVHSPPSHLLRKILPAIGMPTGV